MLGHRLAQAPKPSESKLRPTASHKCFHGAVAVGSGLSIDDRGEAVEARPPRSGIRQVKREIRILALAWFPAGEGSLEFVGVVFRGGLWLDGFIRARACREPGVLERDLSQAVRNSPHYGQIRLIMSPLACMGVKLPFDAPILVEKTGLPVILYASSSGGVKPFGLSSEAAATIVAESCAFWRKPEPLRVAALIAGAVKNM